MIRGAKSKRSYQAFKCVLHGLIANFIRQFYHRQGEKKPSFPIIYRFSKEKRGNFSKHSSNFSK